MIANNAPQLKRFSSGLCQRTLGNPASYPRDDLEATGLFGQRAAEGVSGEAAFWMQEWTKVMGAVTRPL
jgi:hypothetical protein